MLLFLDLSRLLNLLEPSFKKGSRRSFPTLVYYVFKVGFSGIGLLSHDGKGLKTVSLDTRFFYQQNLII